MVHPVQQKVQTVQRRVRRWTTLYGVAASVLLIVAAALVLGLLDYLLRPEDFGLRLLGSLTLLGVSLGCLVRFLVPALTARPSELVIAQRIEQHFPHLLDRLSSSIQFVGQAEEDATAGSPELRRAVVAQAAAELETLDLNRCLDPRRPRRVAWWAAGACLLVTVCCVLDASSAALAARRLALPWQEARWPRRHALEFVDPPRRVATGSDLELAVIDRHGQLPDVVRLLIRFAGEQEIQTKEMKLLGERMVYRLDNVRRALDYRAAGGDDDAMPWIPLEVVEPVRVESLQVRLYPPDYTGWPASKSGENIHGLEGTLVEVSGRLDQAAREVTLRMESSEAVEEIPARLSADGREFSLSRQAAKPWRLKHSGQYAFDMTDPQGLRGGKDRRWNVLVVPDAAPVVNLDKPGTNTFVTAAASIPLAGTAKDDLAIRQIVIHYHRSDAPADQEATLQLYRGPEALPQSPGGGPSSALDRGQTLAIDQAWDLAGLEGLQPGIWIEYTLRASDYKPQTGQCTVRRLTIISPQELEERLAARLAFILNQLVEVLRVQQDTRAQGRSIEVGLESTGRIHKTDVDQLQSAELNQRRVGKLLGDPQDGVAVQLTAILDELAGNRVDNPEMKDRMDEALSVVRRLGDQPLPDIQRDLITALKIARAALAPGGQAATAEEATPDPSLAAALRGVGRRQEEVIADLERLLEDLARWDSYRRFAREITRVRDEQATLLRETDQLQLQTIGRSLTELDSRLGADLKRLTERQTELARRFDKIVGRMAAMREDLREADPLASQTLGDALDVARRRAISGQMRESSRSLAENRLGQSAQTQQAIDRGLEDLLDSLANRREHELDRRIRGLREAADELERLRGEQKTVRQQLEQAQAHPDDSQRRRELERLARREDELSEEVQRLARRLERLQAGQTRSALEEASATQKESGQAGREGRAAEAVDKARQAEQQLDQAQQKLRAERQQVEQDLFHERLVRLEQLIAAWIVRQQSLQDTTAELDGLRQTQDGQLTRGQLTTIADSATQQRTLAGEVLALSEKMADTPVFSLALQGVTSEMDHAARGLDRREIGPKTQNYQHQARLRLEQIQRSLQQDQGSQPSPNSGDNGEQPQDQPPGDAVQRLAEVKLLKWMQEEVNRQTKALQDLRQQQGGLQPDQQQRIDELAAEQGRLAELIEKLAQPPVSPLPLPDEVDQGKVEE